MCSLTLGPQIRVYPQRVHSDHRVRVADGHPGGDPQEVPQPHHLCAVLPKPLHGLALGGHGGGLSGNAAVHGGVDQCPSGPPEVRRQGEDAVIMQHGTGRNWPPL